PGPRRSCTWPGWNWPDGWVSLHDGHDGGTAWRPATQEWGETRHFDPFCACRRPGTPHLWTACGFGLVPGGARRRAVYYQARPDKHGPRLRLKTISGRGISSW